MAEEEPTVEAPVSAVKKKEAKGKKIRTKRPTSKKWSFYKVEGGKVSKSRKSCPKCGQATFLASHKNRESCGKCGYTVFKTSPKPEPEAKPESTPEPVKQQ